MVVKEPKTFYDAFVPLVYINCFVGLGTFRQPNQSDTMYSFMKLYIVVINVIFWVTIYVTLNSIEQVLDFANAPLTAITMFKALVYTNSFHTVIAPFLAFFNRKVWTDCLRQMAILDSTFEAVFGARNEYRKEYISVTCEIVVIVFAMFFVGMCDCVVGANFEFFDGSIRSLLTVFSVGQAIHHPILTMFVMDLNFCTYVRYLGKKFRDLNGSLLRLAKEPSTRFSNQGAFRISHDYRKMTTASEVITNRHYLIRENRKAHLKLSELSRKINLAFGIQNLLSTGLSFVMITGLLYNMYCAFVSNNSAISRLEDMTSPALWAAIYIFKIWMVNHSCETVSIEARRTGEVIYELLNSRVDKELQKEIREFGIQMLHSPVHFHTCGFFSLGHTFVQGVIGSITTYLVILIQMSYVSVSSTSNLALASNDTRISTN